MGIRRALKTKGVLVFIEHVPACEEVAPMLAAAQKLFQPAQMALCNGCDVLRDSERLLRQAGPWESFVLERYSLPFGLLITPHIRGMAMMTADAAAAMAAQAGDVDA